MIKNFDVVSQCLKNSVKFSFKHYWLALISLVFALPSALIEIHGEKTGQISNQKLDWIDFAPMLVTWAGSVLILILVHKIHQKRTYRFNIYFLIPIFIYAVVNSMIWELTPDSGSKGTYLIVMVVIVAMLVVDIHLTTFGPTVLFEWNPSRESMHYPFKKAFVGMIPYFKPTLIWFVIFVVGLMFLALLGMVIASAAIFHFDQNATAESVEKIVDSNMTIYFLGVTNFILLWIGNVFIYKLHLIVKKTK